MTVEVSGSMTIPTIQYGNLSPSFTVTAGSLHEARDAWLREARELYRAVGKDFDLQIAETTPELPSTATKQVCVASGTAVMFDPVTHTYGPGTWLSGSAFAKRFQPEFPAEIIAQKIAAKHGVQAADVLAWWAKNSEIATTYGSSIHAGIEAYGKYRELAAITKDDGDAALPKNPHIRDAVEQFFEHVGDRDCIYEAFVADEARRLCGFVDLLVKTGPASFIIEDHKTTRDIHDKVKIQPPFADVVDNTKVGIFFLQMSFYANIVSAHGYQVDGLRVNHWDGTRWSFIESEVIDVEPGL